MREGGVKDDSWLLKGCCYYSLRWGHWRRNSSLISAVSFSRQKYWGFCKLFFVRLFLKILELLIEALDLDWEVSRL
jgi:hypothetical protein